MDAIDEALESASVLVAVGTSRKHLDSTWVKSEINQFRSMMNQDDHKKRTIISYRSDDYPPNALPPGLQQYQFFADKQQIVLFIETFLRKKADLLQGDGFTSDALCDGSAETPAEESRRVQIGSVLNNLYKILSILGRGGTSYVYSATDLVLSGCVLSKKSSSNTVTYPR